MRCLFLTQGDAPTALLPAQRVSKQVLPRTGIIWCKSAHHLHPGNFPSDQLRVPAPRLDFTDAFFYTPKASNPQSLGFPQ